MRAHDVRTRPLAAGTTVPVMTDAQRHTYRGLVLAWMGAVAAFWLWWCWPSHVVSLPRFLLTSFVIGYAIAMPAYFLFFVSRMRRPNPALEPPRGLRVAFATTFVPGPESIEVLERTISAMRDQEGPAHDVWVLDEGDVPAVRELCRRVGARHFSRKGVARYQAAVWPFKARTKAGNYNAWLHWLRESGIDYDVLLQMDTDHVPRPGYLAEMLRPFADPAVAYVAAPSIVSANGHESWVAAGRYEMEATLHGALQMGYNGGYAPIIIGSHAAFRVSALRAIGGFQHTLAEDHHNTLRLNASGMRGVFNPDAIAIGEGAASFADAMVQEYQWARALTQILLGFFPRDGRTLPSRIWAQLLFAETWYPLFGVSQALGWLMPMVALVSGQPWVQVGYVQFAALQGLSTITCLLLVVWLRRRGWLRPANAAVLSWRASLLVLARWPFVLLAVLEAAAGRVLGRDFTFRVTPKGSRERKPLPLRVLAPYVLLALGPLLAAAWYLRQGVAGWADGYLYLALASAVTYLALVLAVAWLNQRENVRTWHVPRLAAWRMHAPGYAVALGLAAVLAAVGTAAMPRAAQAALGLSPGQMRAALLATSRPATPPDCAGSEVTALELAARAAAARPAPTRRAACAVVALPLDRPFLGVYDPAGTASMPADAEEVFVQWKPGVGQDVRTETARILSERRVPVVTVEPFPWNVEGLTAQTLLTDIATGRYDPTVADIAAAVAAQQPAPVYLRFAHEMDLTGLYPWSRGDPSAYIAAYRRFVTIVRAAAPNALFIWSPSGAADSVPHGSAAYYPGSDVVDDVGVTVLVADRWPGVVLSFDEVMRDRYSLAVQVGKPLVVAELGASIQDPVARARWLEEARTGIGRYPLLVGAVYFDAAQPPLHQADVMPDWRLTPSDQAAFFAAQGLP